jgi:hypothetical protein
VEEATQTGTTSMYVNASWSIWGFFPDFFWFFVLFLVETCHVPVFCAADSHTGASNAASDLIALEPHRGENNT